VTIQAFIRKKSRKSS